MTLLHPYLCDDDDFKGAGLLPALNVSGEFEMARSAYASMPQGWKDTIWQKLLVLGELQIAKPIDPSRPVKRKA